MTNQEILATKIAKVYEVFDKLFAKYDLSQMFLSFNGGKDCTVLLDLIFKYLNERRNDLKLTSTNLRIIYIQPANPFEEVERFVESCKSHYKIEIQKETGKLKSILENVCNNSPELKAVFMGCRRTDPYCDKLGELQPTDSGWPPLLRVNPLLDWNCKNIWDYILSYNVPYCSLYDNGYTSIGDMSNTQPNPHLKHTDSEGNVCYRPAYELNGDLNERAGRS